MILGGKKQNVSIKREQRVLALFAKREERTFKNVSIKPNGQ